MKFRYLISALLLSGSFSLMADAPSGYYDSCDGKTQRALKSQLYSIVKSHTAIPYGTGSGSTWTAFRSTDVDESDNTWYDIYTTNRVAVSGSTGAASGMNIEHTFPKSWWGGANNDAYKDIGHLMPCNSVANSTRGNYPYAEVGSARTISSKCDNPNFKYGTPVSGQGGGASLVFEPADEYKGDLARNYFYMVTCYQNLSWSTDGLHTAAQGDYPTLQSWAIELLLKWHRQDPVSEKELKRNDGLYKVQKNRNPFIDHPEFAEHIWGNLQDEAWHDGEDPVTPPVTPTGDPELTSPINGDYYTFADVQLSESLTLTVPVLGTNFTHSLAAKIEGTDARCFSIVVGSTALSALTISASDINDAAGYYLKVRYTPDSFTAANELHAATLTFTGQDLETPVVVNLQGTCFEQVTLTPVVALEPEDVTDNSYTIRWTPSVDTVDTYTIYRCIHALDESDEDEEIEYDVDATQTSFQITDRDPASTETYYITASFEGVESAPSNTITVAASTGIGSVYESEAAAAYFTVDGIALPEAPTAPGLYIKRTANTATTIVVR